LVSILAGQQPPPSPFGFIRFIPWAMRLLLLVPLIQMAGVAVTLRRVRLWRLDPQRRPSRGRMWREHVLLPLITNLSLAALPVSILASKMRGFILLFLPDFSWTALICGGFACVWAFLRTGLILRTMRPRTPS
jgi:hypothetical protein